MLVPNAFYRSVALDGTVASDVERAKRNTEWRGAATDDAILGDAKAYRLSRWPAPGGQSGEGGHGRLRYRRGLRFPRRPRGA